MTISIPEELKSKMDRFSEDVNWSGIARKAFRQRVEDMDFLEQLAKKSRFTEQDALELGRKINKSLSKQYPSGV